MREIDIYRIGVEGTVAEQRDHCPASQLAGYFHSGEGIVSDHHRFNAPAFAEVGPPARQFGRWLRQRECGHWIAHLGHHQSAEFKKTKVACDKKAALSVTACVLDMFDAFF